MKFLENRIYAIHRRTLLAAGLAILLTSSMAMADSAAPDQSTKALVASAEKSDATGKSGEAGPNELFNHKRLEKVYEMYRGFAGKFPEVPEIRAGHILKTDAADKYLYVDVRTPEEQAVSMLPGAITATEFERRLMEDPGKLGNRPVVIYCTIGYRSAQFSRKMKEKGLSAPANLAGGMLAWTLEGGRIFDKNGETHRIHVYGKEWDLPAAGYESVRFSVWDRLMQ